MLTTAIRAGESWFRPDCCSQVAGAPRVGFNMLNFFRLRSATAKDDVLSGLTVALALVPEAIAFAFVAGVSPLIGLYSAFFIGLIEYH